MRTFKPLQLAAALITLAAMPQSASAALVIAKAPTSNVECVDGICRAIAQNAVLNVNDLTAMLASSAATVIAAGDTEDIDIDTTLSWASTSELTLDAARSIDVKRPVMISGGGTLDVITDHAGSGGDLVFVKKGSVTFRDLFGSALFINDKRFTLVGDIAALSDYIAANPSGNFALANDYDASVDGTFAQSPIVTPFNGTFEGLGHRLSNLKITVVGSRLRQNVGLFSTIVAGGTARDIDLRNGAISVNADHRSELAVGMLAGESEGQIISAYSQGLVSATVTYPQGIGGLVGLVGRQNQSTVRDSHASVKVSGSTRKGRCDAGGLIGALELGVVSNSSATGYVSAYSQNYAASAGGFAGSIGGQMGDAAISASYATGDAKANGSRTDYAGGFVGENDGWIKNSYAIGSTHGGDAGGFEGVSYAGTTEDSYSIGTVVNGPYRGGFVGADLSASEFTGAYWDFDTSGVSDPSKGAGNIANDSGITGLTDAQLKSGLPSGFDPAIWAQNASTNNGYPYLLANPPPQ